MLSNYRIKLLHTNDYPALTALHDRSQWSYQSTELRTTLESGDVVYLGVSTVDQQLIGFISCDMTPEKKGLIKNLLIDKTYRGQGLGTQLIKRMEDYLRQQGVSLASLHVRTTNQSAIQLYTHLGYQKQTLLKGYYHKQPGDAYLMIKNLG